MEGTDNLLCNFVRELCLLTSDIGHQTCLLTTDSAARQLIISSSHHLIIK
jgi:hypothetical protein